MIEFLETDGAIRCSALHEVRGAQVMGMAEARSGNDFRERPDGFAVEACHALGLVWHHNGALAQRILGGNTCRAFISVAMLGLNAAHGEHEATRSIAPVSSHGHDAGHIKGRRDFAGDTYLDAVSQIGTHQG